ncbi:MAG: FtsH-binding integral membrane protein, partial [Vicingaceae bacterium]
MIDYSNNNSNPEYSAGHVQAQDTTKSFLANVFTYMSGALAITGFLAYWFGNSPELMSNLVSPMGGATLLGYVVMFAPLAFILVMSFAFSKLSSVALLGL